jgi:hypothetical protein
MQGKLTTSPSANRIRHCDQSEAIIASEAKSVIASEAKQRFVLELSGTRYSGASKCPCLSLNR